MTMTINQARAALRAAQAAQAAEAAARESAAYDARPCPKCGLVFTPQSIRWRYAAAQVYCGTACKRAAASDRSRQKKKQ